MPLIGWKTRGLTPDQITLVSGKRYRGTVELAWYQTIASNEDVAGKFRELGFTDVKVTGSGSIRSGEGTWSKPDQAIDKPAQIKKVEPVEV
jgi:hypothetical protein